MQRRRELPTRVTQAFQLKVPLRLMRRFPPLRHVAGRFIGLGVRPEHGRPAGIVALR